MDFPEGRDAPWWPDSYAGVESVVAARIAWYEDLNADEAATTKETQP